MARRSYPACRAAPLNVGADAAPDDEEAVEVPLLVAAVVGAARRLLAAGCAAAASAATARPIDRRPVRRRAFRGALAGERWSRRERKARGRKSQLEIDAAESSDASHGPSSQTDLDLCMAILQQICHRFEAEMRGRSSARTVEPVLF